MPRRVQPCCCALLLARWLDDRPWVVDGRSVLEIGAGTGYVGLIAAALGASVTFTDQPQLLELLRKNVERNALAGAGVAELTWGDEAALRALAGPAGSRLLHSPPRLSSPPLPFRSCFCSKTRGI